jgi:hypothetical protein
MRLRLFGKDKLYRLEGGKYAPTMCESFTRVAEKLSRYSVESGGLSADMGNVADLEINRETALQDVSPKVLADMNQKLTRRADVPWRNLMTVDGRRQ